MTYPKQSYIPVFEPQVSAPGVTPANTTRNNDEGLLNAIRLCNPELCKQFIVKDPEILQRTGWNNLTPLHQAGLSGQISIVQLFIENGANPNAQNSFEETPLHYACRRGVVAVVHYMIQHGADPYLVDKKGRNCMHFAVLNGNVCMLHYLDACTDLNLETPDVTGRNMLHIAVEMWHLPALQYLTKHNRIDPSLKDLRGVTPLHIAVQKGFGEFAWILLHVGGCELLKIENQNNESPLDIAKKGTSPNQVNMYQVFSQYAASSGPPAGPIYSWYFLLTLPFLYLAVMFTLSFYSYGYGGHLCVLMSAILMNFFRKQSHRIAHVCRWSNPVYVGLFVGGILHCAIAEFGFLYRAIWPCPIAFFVTTVLAGICIYLLTFLIFGNPGVDTEPMYCETFERPMSILDLANSRVHESQYCPYTEKIHGFDTKYCKICEQPIIKLDHHCLFLNTCIAMNNHRHFVTLILTVMALQISFVHASINFMVIYYGDSIGDSGLGDPFTPYMIYSYKANPWIFCLTVLCIMSFMWEGALVYAQLSLIMRGTTTYRTLKKNHKINNLTKMKMLQNVVTFFTKPGNHQSTNKSKSTFHV